MEGKRGKARLNGKAETDERGVENKWKLSLADCKNHNLVFLFPVCTRHADRLIVNRIEVFFFWLSSEITGGRYGPSRPRPLLAAGKFCHLLCLCVCVCVIFYDVQLNFIQMTLGHITIYIRQSLFGISFIFGCFRFIRLDSAESP